MSVLRVEKIAKTFALSHNGGGSLKTALLWWKRRKLEKLEVLREISFEVQPGECVALVGKNGAGKSTLLSLIAKVYKPSSGSIRVDGRLAPLLELGAGFHPDLTGAENILFNGVILGLSRQETRNRMAEIVAFSGIGSHIDAPVRTYSSGMLARLGFSIAVHVDADLLIVDEVLAVGDFEFEQKCFQRLEEFRAAGGAILFVSHDTDAVRRIADRAIWLEKGTVRLSGPTEEVLRGYLGGAV